ncbi:aldehyde dehydrogenase family protein [Chitinimonas koreensis]|uniref:aldehyde dehydrogenase family protein n=1 Tax=Chitinimonas koreensis TaxID=356302 RepID=UPI000420DF11|nr:aldehyde dehydrogenase family protein [Chitinimonas koreensis]QNM95131.1 aldehyde dehydrogenase family protein [Chitinimonas koreensis]
MSAPSHGAAFVSRDPRSGEVFAARAAWPAEALGLALSIAESAQARWAATAAEARAAPLLRLAAALEAAAPALAASIGREMGKLPAEAADEIQRAANWCRFLAERAPEWLAEQRNGTGRLRRRPIGPVLAVTPWNYPVWQMLRPLAAAVAAGNAVLVKPAPGVARTSALVEAICRDVLPPGLVQCLWLDQAGTRRALADPAVAMLVCTGSERTGRRLGALAGRHLKPAVLELGGNNPCLILDDADLAAAAAAAAESRCLNAGQACTAAKRFIVHQAVAERFVELLCETMARYRCGDTLAPLANAAQRQRLQTQVDASLAAGARCLLGGRAGGGRGDYFPATVLAEVQPGMAAFDEELFGPVAAVTVARDDDEAGWLAGAVRQQLAAAVWSADAARAERLAGRLRAGVVCFNRRTGSRFELPFAGSGASGHGSTLGQDGLLAFTQPVGWLA